ncbi:MAG TPA: hypothetical protein V6C52_08735 [Coleofasciculaceae cyanobacterium]|jgi:hypothetical protein
MNTTSDHEWLRRTIRTFDRLLHRPILTRLGLDALPQVLGELDRFHQAVRLSPPATPDTLDERSFLVAAGCRLSVDLNEALAVRLMDTVQEHDEAISQLSRQLSERLQARNQAAQLLKKTQALKQQTVETGETAGLGMVL